MIFFLRNFCTEILAFLTFDFSRTLACSVGQRAIEGTGNEIDEIDFSPVYKCLHIATLEDNRENFLDTFIAERNKQMGTLVAPSTQIKDDKISDYIYSIVGFLYIEEELQSSSR